MFCRLRLQIEAATGTVHSMHSMHTHTTKQLGGEGASLLAAGRADQYCDGAPRSSSRMHTPPAMPCAHPGDPKEDAFFAGEQEKCYLHRPWGRLRQLVYFHIGQGVAHLRETRQF